MERSQACSLGSDDSLNLLIARRDRLTEHIERSYDYLCEDLESSGIGRGKCYREPRRRAPPVSQVMSAQVPVRSPGNLKSVQARAQRMMGKGRGAVLKKNLMVTNPSVVDKPIHKCYKCGEGHLSRDCHYWPKDPTVCWRCHKSGHFHRECRNVKDTATQTHDRRPQICRKERELHHSGIVNGSGGGRRQTFGIDTPTVKESGQMNCQQVKIEVKEEENEQSAVIKKVSFSESTEGCEDEQVGSPGKCSTPSDADGGKHTPIVFIDNPESPEVSPVRIDLSIEEVGNSPQLPVPEKSPGNFSMSNMSDSLMESFITSLLEENSKTPEKPEVKQESSESMEVNMSNSSSVVEVPETVVESPNSVRRKCIMCKSMFDILLSRGVEAELD